MNPDRDRWNAKHRAGGPQALPCIPLLQYQDRLARGRALDLAGGLGENAALLALAGWQVTLADLSDEALACAARRARDLKTQVRLVQADALRLPFRGPFDLVVVARFLERSIAGDLVRLLAPRGTLFCEQPMRGLKDDYLVKPGDFPRLFPALETVLLDEDGSRAVYIGRSRG